MVLVSLNVSLLDIWLLPTEGIRSTSPSPKYACGQESPGSAFHDPEASHRNSPEAAQ